MFVVARLQYAQAPHGVSYLVSQSTTLEGIGSWVHGEITRKAVPSARRMIIHRHARYAGATRSGATKDNPHR